MRTYWVYIMTNAPMGTLYIGVTNNLGRRAYEHAAGIIPGFTKRYELKNLVYYEEFSEVTQAIAREKQLKGWLRRKKLALIAAKNPAWDDLRAHFTL